MYQVPLFQRTVTLNLSRIERSIKQHGHCKKDCSYFERSSADSWRVQVYFLLIRPMNRVVYNKLLRQEIISSLIFPYVYFPGYLESFLILVFVELILQILCKVVLSNPLFISSELFSSLLFNIT